VSELGAGFVGEMRKHLATRTYAQAKPRALTDEQWCVCVWGGGGVAGWEQLQH
jgi:hypothetical protein